MADATDNFNRASIGTDWTNKLNTIVTSASTVVKGGTASDENAAMWNANTFPSNQYAQLKIATDADGGGPAVRMQAGANTWYEFYSDSSQCSLFEVTNGGYSTLGAQYIVNTVVNDVIKLDATGSTLTPSVNAGALATRTDTSITGGSPGIHIWGTTATFDDWLGGPISGGGVALGSGLLEGRLSLPGLVG